MNAPPFAPIIPKTVGMHATCKNPAWCTSCHPTYRVVWDYEIVGESGYAALRWLGLIRSDN